MGDSWADKRVLVVDDDEDILTAIQAAVSDHGATVTQARDGNQAVELAGTVDPDAVVLDMMLPKRSGFLVLEQLKKGKPRNAGPFVVMITGNLGRRHQSYADALGADAYLNKPFRMERLIEELSKALGPTDEDAE